MPPILIVEADPAWADRFSVVADELTLVFARDAIHHIGSTSVPGLAAKDIIDVQVSVPALDEEALRGPLEAIGYSWLSDITRDHPPFGWEVADGDLAKALAQRRSPWTVNLHLRIPGRANHRYALLFRDYLRAQPSAVAAYAEVKRQLARLFPVDVDAYYDVKEPVMDLIAVAAEEWAASAGWVEPQPGH